MVSSKGKRKKKFDYFILNSYSSAPLIIMPGLLAAIYPLDFCLSFIPLVSISRGNNFFFFLPPSYKVSLKQQYSTTAPLLNLSPHRNQSIINLFFINSISYVCSMPSSAQMPIEAAAPLPSLGVVRCY